MDMTSTWEQDVRACEETVRAAFLAADIETLDAWFADEFIVNSPLQKVVDKPTLFELLRAGRIRHTSFKAEIETVVRHGDTVVVMGHDVVTDPPEDITSRRRFTNIWQWQNGAWKTIGRHAHVVSRDPA